MKKLLRVYDKDHVSENSFLSNDFQSLLIFLTKWAYLAQNKKLKKIIFLLSLEYIEIHLHQPSKDAFNAIPF